MRHRLNIFLTLFFLISAPVLRAADGHPTPKANFEVINLCWGGLTTFSNTSADLENEVFQWTIWQMGNATPIYTSSATSISFQFTVKTTYTVELTVANYITPTHFHVDGATRTIFVDSLTISNFDFRPCLNKFVDLSCCATSYLWDFGDGTPTSTLSSPGHTYTAIGNYTVTLISCNGSQCDTSSQVVSPYMNVLLGTFNVTMLADTFLFKSNEDSLIADQCDWEWDFGDGTDIDTFGAGGWKAKHYYQPAERDTIYTASLLVRDPCFFAESEKYIFVKGTGKTITGTTVFPSPILNGHLNIESVDKDKITEIRIVDLLGKRLDNLTVWDKPYGYYVKIDALATGIYIVQLVFTDRIENHKIIKE